MRTRVPTQRLLRENIGHRSAGGRRKSRLEKIQREHAGCEIFRPHIRNCNRQIAANKLLPCSKKEQPSSFIVLRVLLAFVLSLS